MTASEEDLNQLSLKLWQNGIAAFCPTTLSEKPGPLLTSVRRLGHWIRSFDRFYGPGPQKKTPGAIPLGIHLEGPFIHPKSCGAHPPQTIRPLSIQELESLWEASQQTLKIITLAPELISSANLTRVIRWAKAKKIHLSLGHSQATTEEARLAFQKGIQGVTHAWNALPFHHRSPGPLGAAIGNPEIFLELILDQIHVDPVLIRWTQKLHPPERLCYISDCAPAAGTRGKLVPFGPLRVCLKKGASRLSGGSLAGGGLLLSEGYLRWLETEAQFQKKPLKVIFNETIQGLTSNPLELLGIHLDQVPFLQQKQILWDFGKNQDSPLILI